MEQSETEHFKQSVAWPRWTKRLALCGIGTFLLLTGLWGARESGNRADLRFRRDLARKAIAVAEAIPVDEAEALTFTEADRNLPEFKRISAQLKAYSRAMGLRCLYTMALRDGQIYFGPEGLDPGGPLSSPPGTLYEEPAAGDFEIFKTAEPLVQGPYTDEYGPYISATAPVIDPKTGKVLLVAGLDADPAVWQAEIRKAQSIPLLIPICGFIILGIGMGFIHRRLRHSSNRSNTFHTTEMLSCAAIMLLLTIGISLLIRQMDTFSRDEVFNSAAQLKANAYTDAFAGVHDQLQMLSDLFESSELITKEEFGHYCRKAITSYLIQTRAWLPDISPERLGAFEQQVRSEGVPHVSLQPSAADNPSAPGHAFPILYREPITEADLPLGYNMYADSRYRTAIEECLRSGHATASITDTPGHDTKRPTLIHTFQPAGNSQQKGVASFAINPAKLAKRAVTGTSELSVVLMEIAPDGTQRSLMCSHDDCSGLCWTALQTGQHRIFPFFKFGRTYALVVAPNPDWYKSHPLRNPQIALIAGLILTVLSTGLVGILANRPIVLERLIRERTSDLKRSEERFKIAASAAGIGVWDLDLSNDLLIWDPRMLAIHGIGQPDFDGTYDAWMKFIHPDDLEQVTARITAAGRGGNPLDIEFRIMRMDGEVRHIHAYAEVSHDDKGTPSHMIGVNLDITENKIREARITAQLDELNRWQNVTMGRERRVLRLKEEVNDLLGQFSLPPRYKEVMEGDKSLS